VSSKRNLQSYKSSLRREVAGRKAAEKRLTVVDAELTELQDDYEQAIAICDAAEDRLVASEHGNAVLLATIEDDEKIIHEQDEELATLQEDYNEL
jgi:chromosome segregation ATPase